jgi:hypothetical protein
MLISFVCFAWAVSAGEEPSPSVSVGSATEIQAAGLGGSRGFSLPVYVTEPAKVGVTVRLLTFVEGKIHQSCKFDYQWNKKDKANKTSHGTILLWLRDNADIEKKSGSKQVMLASGFQHDGTLQLVSKSVGQSKVDLSNQKKDPWSRGGGGIVKVPSGAETVLCCFGFGELPAGGLKTIEDLAKASQGGQVIVAATLRWDLKGK